MVRRVFSLLAALVVIAFSPGLRAQCSDWSERFAQPGVSGGINSLVVFDDGSGPALYAGGLFGAVDGQNAGRLARWNGSSWTPIPIGVAGGEQTTVKSLAVFDDGSGPALYVGGDFTLAGGIGANRIARWNASGWSALGSGVNGIVNALAVFDDGSGSALYVGGHFTSAGGASAPRIAKWKGGVWSGVGGGISGTQFSVFVNSLFVDDDGSGPALYAGGGFTNAGGVPALNIARWDGSSWSALGTGVGTPNFGDQVLGLAGHDDGSGHALYACGTFDTSGGAPTPNVARWDGTTWSAVGQGFVGQAAWALFSFDDGSGPALYAGGQFSLGSGGSAVNVARWDGASWAPVGPGLSSYVFSFAAFDAGSGPKLHAGGLFTIVSGMLGTTGGLARWDGGSWTFATDDAHGFNGWGRALAVFDQGDGAALYAGGDFTAAGTTPASHVARWKGTGWEALAGGLDGKVHALAAHDDGSGPALYAGGEFVSSEGTSTSRVARWDGVAWSGLGHGVTGTVEALHVHDQGSGPELYAGGVFNVAGSRPANGIARWNGSEWFALGTGMNATVQALASYDEGAGPVLIAAGYFTSAGGAPVAHIARWDGDVWTPVGAGLQGTDAHVDALALYDSGSGPELYAGGFFSSAGGAPATNLARWNGLQWTAVDSPIGPVRSMYVFDDGSGPALYVGSSGTFGNTFSRYDGSTWTPVGNPLYGEVFGMAAFDDGIPGGADLYIAGGFSLIGGDTASKYIGAWLGCKPPPEPYCFGDGSNPTPCPCGNTGDTGRGCANSSTSGARLAGSGTTVPDTLVLTASDELASALSIFLQGTSSTATAFVFGDGVRCAGGSLLRIAARNAVGGVVSYPHFGESSISARSALLGAPIAPGSVRYYQTYYRDPVAGFCPPASFNATNAVLVVW